MDFENLRRKIIAIDSTPSHSCQDVARFVFAASQVLGLEAKLLPVAQDESEDFNICVSLTGASHEKSGLLLQSHLDTADPGHYFSWTQTDQNPFAAQTHDGKIFGLGAAQGKLDFVAKLEALCALKSEKLDRPVYLVGTFGAEAVGMPGVSTLLKQLPGPVSDALVTIPSQMRPVSETNGLLILDIEIPFSNEEREFVREHNAAESTSTHSRVFKGRSAHSSAPETGESAIAKLITYLGQLPEQLMVMCLEGGSAYNVVPGEAYLEIEMSRAVQNHVGLKFLKVAELLPAVRSRLLDEYSSLNMGMVRTTDRGLRLGVGVRWSPKVSGEFIVSWLAQLRFELEAFGAELRIRDQRSPFRLWPSDLFRGCQEELRSLSLPSDPVVSFETSECSVLSDLGVNCVPIGPGLSAGNSHSPNECVPISELETATRLYTSLVRRVCK